MLESWYNGLKFIKPHNSFQNIIQALGANTVIQMEWMIYLMFLRYTNEKDQTFESTLFSHLFSPQSNSYDWKTDLVSMV